MGRFICVFAVALMVCGCDSVEETITDNDQAGSQQTLTKTQRRSRVVCHREGRAARYVRKLVPEVALLSHLRHGDGEPGDMIPEVTGMEFDGSCNPVPSPCVCWSSTELRQIASIPDHYLSYSGISDSTFYAWMGFSDQVGIYYDFPFPQLDIRTCFYLDDHELIRLVDDIALDQASRCLQSLLDTGNRCEGNLCPD